MSQREIAYNIYNDYNHSTHIYDTLQKLVEVNIIKKTNIRPVSYAYNANSNTTIKANIPTPSNKKVEYWLNEWDKLDDYVTQEEAIDYLFTKTYINNNEIKNIIIKCSVVNDFYSTNIFRIYDIANHILDLHIDERLAKGKLELVNDMAKLTISNKELYFYSFATKYCSHHKTNIYPIHDYYVERMLTYFRKKDKFFNFKNDDLKDYINFRNIIDKFKSFYNLNNYNYKDIDRYLWQACKYYFKRKY